MDSVWCAEREGEAVPAVLDFMHLHLMMGMMCTVCICVELWPLGVWSSCGWRVRSWFLLDPESSPCRPLRDL